jgi:hypothetical protein
VFIALFAIAKETTQMSHMDEWIKKMWYIHTMKYYSAIRKIKILCLKVNGWNWRTSC